MEHLKLNKIKFDGIRGLWSKTSDNTIEFNKAIINDGLSLEKSAFKTWSGERALENGFNKVSIDFLTPIARIYSHVTIARICNPDSSDIFSRNDSADLQSVPTKLRV